MSYNTRRAGGFVNQQSVGNVGQRRPVVTNNFVPGGQLNPTNKPVQPQQQQARPPVQNQQAPNTSIQFRNQQNSLPQQTNVQPPIPQTKQQFEQQFQQQQPQLQLQQLQQQEQLQQQHLQKQQLQQQQVKNETSESIVPMIGVEEAVDPTVEKKKPFWAKAGRISKKEKVRRRNIRLSKILQPKNAVMILNELVKNTSYMVEDLPSKTDENQFKATVLYEGQECVGYGRSKIHAKNSAAEAALRHYVKNNKMTEMRRDEEGNVKMEVSEEDLTKSPLPWQHVASFAIFKLFSSWGEDPNLAKSQQTSTETMSGVVPKPHENRPSRKMPANPETINPLMLINQMLPHAHFEEVGKSGTPPNVVFTFECIVDEQRFMGTGSNKKAAKKLAAYGACHKILSINYPPEVYTPLY